MRALPLARPPAGLLPAGLLPAALLLAGCGSSNPVGFWDITRLSITTDALEASQDDVGTLEITESDGIIAIFRYELLDPATLGSTGAPAGGADSGAGAEDAGSALFLPVTPPRRGRGEWSDKEVMAGLRVGGLSLSEAEQVEWRSTAMAYEDGDATLHSSPVQVRLELSR
jgi:uncharacterized protein (DUF58 family)